MRRKKKGVLGRWKVPVIGMSWDFKIWIVPCLKSTSKMVKIIIPNWFFGIVGSLLQMAGYICLTHVMRADNFWYIFLPIIRTLRGKISGRKPRTSQSFQLSTAEGFPVHEQAGTEASASQRRMYQCSWAPEVLLWTFWLFFRD